MRIQKRSGFTLIELLIALSIIGLLTAIAIPSYTDKIQKSRRADAQGALMQFASAMERRFTTNNSYLGAGSPDTGTPTVFATKSPVDGAEAYYTLTISAATATAFTLSAIPVGKQTSDKCGTLTLTNTGVRGFTGAGMTSSDCW